MTEPSASDDKHGEPAFTRHGDEDCPECRAPVRTPHLDGCSGQFHESAVGTPHSRPAAAQPPAEGGISKGLSMSDPSIEVVQAAWEAYLDATDFSGGFVAAVTSAFRAGRAQAATDIRADRGPLDGLVWRERAALIAEGSQRIGADRGESLLPASTGAPDPRAETEDGGAQ